MDIAIIGMSGIFPEAKSLNEFYLNLLNGVDSVRELPITRRDQEEQKANLFGYVDQIDEFDYRFFKLSRAEAEHMDPHQRILLELVCTAIDNSGYSLESFRGSNTSVILNSPGGPKPEYVDLFEQFHPTLITGNSHAMYAGRISHFLGLRGPSMMIDTSCSSSLTSLHESCNKLILGEADISITGGVRLLPNLNFSTDIKFGMESKSSKCRAFDDSADGIVGGEGGGIVILKPLQKAIEDRDNIHAVIKGSAINQDGDRSNGFTAPSPHAQTEVIIKAWNNAKIDPMTIDYIEAHGTGTYIGDPIEIQGLTDAFKSFTDKTNFCYIGSLKTNIGHLAEAAGIASVIKTILSLKNKKIFPSLHLNKLNTHIDFNNSAVKVNTKLREWDTDNKKARRAGISSFSLSGTNVHMVLEEAPNIQKETSEKDTETYLFTFSAQSQTSLLNFKEKVGVYLADSVDDMRNISFVLNKGRNDFSYRFACTASNKEELIQKLSCPKESLMPQTERPIIFLFSHDFQLSVQMYKYLTNEHSYCKKVFNEIPKVEHLDTENINVKKFIYQYLLYQYWKSVGISPVQVIGTGIGNIVVETVTGKTNLKSALIKAQNFPLENNLDAVKLKKLVLSLQKKNNPMFLSMSGESDLFNSIHQLQNELTHLVVLPSYEENNELSLIEVQSKLYMNGAKINWEKYYDNENIQKVELPTYEFDKQRCWLEPTKMNNTIRVFNNLEVENQLKSTLEKDTSLPNVQVRSVEEQIADVWASALKLEHIDINDDFFDVGGNSLISLHIIENLEKLYNLELEFDLLFEYSTIQTLSDHIKGLIKENTSEVPFTEKDRNPKAKENRQESYPLSFSEESMWYLAQFDRESSSYNVPSGIRLTGNLNENILEKSINDIILRHESLRTVYSEEDGKPVALIKPNQFKLKVIDLQHLDSNLQEKEMNRIYMEESLRPFDLETGPLMRVKLIKLRPDNYLLVVVMHHIISDNWSFQIFQSELVTIYEAFSNNLSSPYKKQDYQYRDFAISQRKVMNGEQVNKHLQFWENKLLGAPTQLYLPTQKKRPEVQSFKGKTLSFEISLKTIAKLEKLSREKDTTLFMTLLSGWKSLLYRYSGQQDMVIGTTVAGRKMLDEQVIGNFVNLLPIRTINPGNPSFSDLLKVVKEETIEAFNHQEFPFNLLIDKLNIPRSLKFTPLFQVIFDYHHNHIVKELEVPGFRVESVEKHIDAVKGDMEMIIMRAQDKMEGLFIYNTDIFEEKEMEILVSNYINLLDIISDFPDTSILEIPLSESQNSIPVKTTHFDQTENFNF